MVSALVELFNYLQADKKSYEILIKEGEQEKLSGLQNPAYNINDKIQQGLITEAEMNLISLKSELVIIRNKISDSNEQKRFLFLYDIQHRAISFEVRDTLFNNQKYIQKIQFYLYGKIMRSSNPLNLKILNSTIVTDYINEGIILLSDCSQRQNNSYEGEILFSGLKVVGQRYLVMQQPLIYIQTLYNVTVDNSEIRSFSSINDASKQQLSIESTSLCPLNADQKIKKTQLTNSYISSDAINGRDQAQIQYNVNCGQRSDFNKRIQQCIIENLTFENLYSGVTLLYLSQGASNLTIRNITQNNVSLGPIQAMHFFITGFTTLNMIDIKFYNCETQGRVIATGLFTYTYIDKLVMINNTCKDFYSNLKSILVDKQKNGLCFIKSSSNPTNAIYSFNNLYFKNNNINSNQSMLNAVVHIQLFRSVLIRLKYQKVHYHEFGI
ncbi:UNKNOWN [Stylonychia lemnae]|uniref:Right handed beta helix domain-containing protein n=1 Tax=Stylonychia lemnae TaxID=5949 RepID=A0A078AQG7_STYLE|nr:UNKNOWN [Stylonychia lemnae]|eukprot:CDW83497.1 UNKNOWN [Stylonychia lemnae]